MGKSARTRVLAADGLRGLAMIAIVLFHLRPTPLIGGFVGVPIFFVLSGFFITVGIDRRIESGTFHYGSYMLHRLTRLWPAMMASIALAVILSVFFAPEYLPKMARDGWSSALLLSNWWLIIAKIPYFAAAGLPSPLKPLWFVALIMQFYLVWGAILWLLRKIFTSDRVVLLITLLLIIASSVDMGLLYDPLDSGRVYYGLDTRFAELLAGAALAMIWEATGGAGRWCVSKRTVKSANGTESSSAGELVREAWLDARTSMWLDIAGWMAFVILVFGFFFFFDGTMEWMYHGGYLFVAICACVVLAAGLAGRSLAKVLSLPVFVHLGTISFAMYLVHFPLLEVMNPATRLTDPSWWEIIIQLLVVWVVTEAFYWTVEKGTVSTADKWRKIVTRTAAIIGAISVIILTLVPASGWESYAQTRRMETIADALKQEKQKQQDELKKREEQEKKEKQEKDQKKNAAKSKKSDKKSGKATKKSSAKSKASKKSAKRSTSQKAESSSQGYAGSAARGGGVPLAEKIPANLDAGRWVWSAKSGTCSAPVLIIGDSVVLGAKADIESVFPHAVMDAEVGRQFTTAVDLFHQHVSRGQKGDVLVVALGANGPIADQSQIRAIMDAVHGMPVFFVTVRGPMMWTDANNALLRQTVSKYRNAGLLDWSGVSAGHPEYFYSDGTHLTPGAGGGRQAWMFMLRRALCGV